jgi:fucose permease
MALIAPRLRGLYVSLFVVFILFGTSMTIIGASLPKILADFSWSYGTAGAVIAASAAMYFIMSMVGGFFLRRFGPKLTMVTGLSLSTIGLAFFAVSPAAGANLILSGLIGAGQGLIEPTVNWSVLRMDEDSSGRAMNLMHGAFSIGAVAGPIIVGLLLAARLSWTLLYRAIAGLFFILALVIVALPFGLLGREAESAAAKNKGGIRSLARSPVYWLGFVSLLLYVGAELGISTWISEYFVRVFDAAPSRGSFMVSLFWIGLLAGRFGAPALYRGRRQEILLVASSFLLVLAVSLLNLLGFVADRAGQAWMGPTLTFLAGLGCSVIYPIVISLVGSSFPNAQSHAVSFAVAGGGLGLFAFPFLMSWISQAWGIRSGFLSYALIAALTSLACVVLGGAFRRERRLRGF